MSKIIYTDIDFVLHNFFISFLKSSYILFQKEMTEEDVFAVMSHGNCYRPLQKFSEKLNMTEDQVNEAVWHSNESPDWYPTPFAQSLIKFLKNRKREGYEILAVTARSSRNGAEKIIKDAFGFDLPVITCESKYKHHVVGNGELFFEDHWKIINTCSEKFPNMQIYVPEWPWNKENVEKRENVHMVQRAMFPLAIDELEKKYEQSK